MLKKDLETMRHSTSHIMAAAVLEMFPEAKLAIGPAIENGFYYDFDLPRTLIPEDLPLIEERMKKIVKEGYPFEKAEVPIKDALKEAKKNNQIYKADLIQELIDKGEKTVTFYRMNGFTDLCKGPHLESTKDVGTFKLTSIAGAYWRGDEKNKMLQRIYGVAFSNQKELDEYLEMLEEAKKRDHRKLGKELELFDMSESVGGGLPLWLPKGAFIRKKLEDYMYNIEKEAGYDLVNTPILAHEKLYKKSGHLSHYKEDMYNPIDIEGEKYYLKPMNCPHHHMIFQTKTRSYRELPIRLSEFGLIHRFERSGVLTGLIRARCFTQNDAHIYCSPEQLKSELVNVLKLIKKVYTDFDIENYWYRLSLPDFSDKEKFGDIENEKLWDDSAETAREALKASGDKYVEAVGEAAFYGPKIDVQIKNVLGKEDTIATVQIDFFMPERFDLEYIDDKGERKRPVIIHRAIMGSFDRFFAFLLEKTAGAFPLWLAPTQVQLIPVSDKFIKFAEKVSVDLKKNNIRVDIDQTTESVGKKIRNAELMKIPYMVVVGEKEEKSGLLPIRSYAGGDLGNKKPDDFIKIIFKEIEERK
jgi:threonyl-tRNA synthetase